MSSPTDFLLARITEDEERLPTRANLDSAAQRRLRAECEAKRRIVEWVLTDDGCYHWTEVLHPLATVYADHPDYREEWKP